MKQPLVEIEAQLASMEADEKLALHDLPRITSQQRVYVAARVGGLGPTAAARQVGCSKNTAFTWEKDPVIQRWIAHYEAEMATETLPRVQFGIEDAHAMYMKAYHCAGTAAEMVKATDSLVKLHRLNERVEKEVPKTVSAKQLADLSVTELLRLAGLKVDSLSPGAIEGEFEEVEDA